MESPLISYENTLDAALQSAKEEILRDLTILVKRGAELPSDLEFTIQVRFVQ